MGHQESRDKDFFGREENDHECVDLVETRRVRVSSFQYRPF